MCRSLPRRWSVPLLLLLSTGCVSTLQLLHEPPAYIGELRTEYLSSNPNSPYRDRVTSGEVVSGMDFFGVLAAWGHPDRRVREQPGFEDWVYIDVDSTSGDAVEYSLAFRDGILDGWDTRLIKSDGLAYREGEAPSQVNPAAPPTGKRVPKN